MRPKLYISGPINGYSDHNKAAFKWAEDILEGRGWDVTNPTTLGRIENPSWKSYLQRDLFYVIEADAVCVLDGWELSPGAKLETDMAFGLRIPVRYLQQYQYLCAEEFLARILY